MAKLTLHFVLHLHQPVGTAHGRIAAAVADQYAPLIELLARQEAAKLALHVGGNLLEWLEAHDRALADRLASLVNAGRAELVGGGFYSPVLALLLWRDAVGQLEMAAGYLQRRTGKRPTGAWLIEQVWMPRMAEILSDAGYRWTLMDERALRSAGVEGEISGWYVTEHAARPIALFATDTALRERVSRDGPDALIDYLRARLDSQDGDLALTWAGTCEQLLAGHGRGMGWLTRLLARAAEERAWLTLDMPSHSLATTAARGRVYVPDSLHPDLVELTLLPAQVPAWRARRPSERGWLLGSVWQAFLARYGEADRLHKRMIEASRRFAALERVLRNHGYRAMSQLTRPRRMLYRGQAGAAFGHGHAAGIHDAQLRAGVYRNLIEAEQACDALVAETDDLDEARVEVSLRDLFADMTTSVLLRSRDLRVVIQPSRGGTLVGLEHIPSRTALHDVLTRRPEAYHRHGEQAVDGHERASLHDRFLLPGADAEAWMTDAAEIGDLLRQPYRLLSVEDEGFGTDAHVTVHLAADGHVTLLGETAPEQAVPVALLKQIEVRAETIRVRWSMEFAAPLPAPCDFAVECNLSSLGLAMEAIDLRLPRGPLDGQQLRSEDVTAEVVVRYPGAGVALYLSATQGLARVDCAPIVTIAQPVGGCKKPSFQGFSLLFRHPLAAGATSLRCELSLRTQGEPSPREQEQPAETAVSSVAGGG